MALEEIGLKGEFNAGGRRLLMLLLDETKFCREHVYQIHE